MSIQTDIDSLLGGGVSVFNLALNVAGIIQNRKNVAIYVQQKGTKGENILEGMLGAVSSITGGSSFLTGSGVIMSAEIVENSKLAEHPLEDGTVSADNKVLLPTEINIQITLQATDYKDIIAKIKDYKNNNIMIYVETKFGVYRNMQIVSIPTTLNADNISRITFSIKLREILVAENLVEMSADTVADVSNATSQNTGYKTGIATELNTGAFRGA